jgi:hypothetical protein
MSPNIVLYMTNALNSINLNRGIVGIEMYSPAMKSAQKVRDSYTSICSFYNKIDLEIK